MLPAMRAPLVSIVLTVLLAACSGSSKHAEDPDEPGPTADAPQEKPEVAAARKRMRERQTAVCEDLCGRLSECAREDALKNSPDALANKDGVSGEQVLAKNTQDCLDSCSGPGSGLMTPDQRKRLVDCFPKDSCAEFVPCTNQALSSP
jgi:hypothetical protein